MMTSSPGLDDVQRGGPAAIPTPPNEQTQPQSSSKMKLQFSPETGFDVKKERCLTEASSSNISISSSPAPKSLVGAGSASDFSCQKKSASHKWTRCVLTLQEPVKLLLVAMAVHAARFPKHYLVTIVSMSVGLAYAGYKTNFRIENREEVLWAPTGSQADLDRNWVDKVFSGKNYQQRLLGAMNWNPGASDFLKHHQQKYPSWWVDDATPAEMVPPIFRDTFENGSDSISTDGSKERKLSENKTNYVAFLVHADGGNVVSFHGSERNFEALDRLQSVPGYSEYCEEFGNTPCPSSVDETICTLVGIPTGLHAPRVCSTGGVTGLWFHNSTIFHSEVETDFDVQKAMAIDIFPGEKDEFDVSNFIGNPLYETLNGTKLLISGTAFFTIVRLPRGSTEIDRLANAMLDELLHLQTEWEADRSISYQLEVLTAGAYEAEVMRAIMADLPLVPIMGCLMMGFTALVFFKRDWLYSQCLLGLGAVACVILSVLSGFGIMFIIGYPFTILSSALVFVIFGVALDDSFVLHAAYLRTDPNKSTIDRVRDFMDEAAISIFMTTATTEFAFGLGALSRIPAIRWLCIYAVTTIGIDFIYQITFFIALVAIDDTRIKAGRRDGCVCFKISRCLRSEEDDDFDKEEHCQETGSQTANSVPSTQRNSAHTNRQKRHFTEKFMSCYADKLLQPHVQTVVLLAFAALFVICMLMAFQLHLYFDFLSVLPRNSFARRFYIASDLYTNRQGPDTMIYFRDVNQSDPKMWGQMEAYVDDICRMKEISRPPFYFWLRDYKEYIAERGDELQNVTFNERLEMFLDETEEKNSYRKDMLFDHEGNLLASRTQVIMDEISSFKISEGVQAFRDLRAITKKQPINQEAPNGEYPFFTYKSIYLLWEFLSITPIELSQSTLIGIGSVSLMSLFCMPHWSGVFFVTPLVMVLYVDLIGFIQFFGIDLNAISFVSLVMAIGLLVDYVMHVVLRYYETDSTVPSRHARVKEALATMGASVLVSGLSTFLGVVPLMFSNNDIILTFVVTFSGVVLLGLTHALVLVPVLLSLLGPQEEILPSSS